MWTKTLLLLPVDSRSCKIYVSWNLLDAPGSTGAVWSFGEGPHLTERIGPVSLLSDSAFMVGKIHSHPSEQEASSKYYGAY